MKKSRSGQTLMLWRTMFGYFFSSSMALWHLLFCLIWTRIWPLNVQWFGNSPCMPEKQVWPSGQPGGWRRTKFPGRNCSSCSLTGPSWVSAVFMVRIRHVLRSGATVSRKPFSRHGETISNSFIAKMSTSTAQQVFSWGINKTQCWRIIVTLTLDDVLISARDKHN